MNKILTHTAYQKMIKKTPDMESLFKAVEEFFKTDKCTCGELATALLWCDPNEKVFTKATFICQKCHEKGKVERTRGLTRWLK